MIPDWAISLPFNLIYDMAAENKLDARLVAAFCYVESGGVAGRVRYEKDYPYLFEVERSAKKQGISVRSETELQKFSWGYIQIMGATARSIGFEKQIPLLSAPKVGLQWGCYYLANLKKKYAKIEDMVSSYNAGSPRVENGIYSNQEYVDRVMSYFSELTKG